MAESEQSLFLVYQADGYDRHYECLVKADNSEQACEIHKEKYSDTYNPGTYAQNLTEKAEEIEGSGIVKL